MKHRYIAVALIHNQQGEYLICKKPSNLGVFPGQWAIPGGGIKPGETIYTALKREVKEEVGLNIKNIKPLIFTDDVQTKYYSKGKKEKLYMVYLIFDCQVVIQRVKLNEEFEEYAWVKPHQLPNYDLNSATVNTLKYKGLL